MTKIFFALILVFTLNAKDNIIPIPFNFHYDKEKAKIGKSLFFDTILSRNNTISCSSCHTLPGNGANTTQFSFGINGQESDLNTPTVLNAVFNFSLFWDGRAKDLHEQALGPIVSQKEMGSDIKHVLAKLSKSEYKMEFEKVYQDGLTQENILDAIVEFEKALTTPNSRFDRYLRGDENALSDLEKRGYTQFQELGCISCHNGVNMGGTMYQKIGILVPYIGDANRVKKKAFEGRINLTQRYRDLKVFKVPSLRNIELTAPYFHDGSVQSLSEAIELMKKHQLGILEVDSSNKELEAFLKTLTGNMPFILRGTSDE